MQTYNGLIVPQTIKTSLIISAFQNEIDDNKISEYATIMANDMLSHQFPPITGYPSHITEGEVGEYFLNGEEIGAHHIGLVAWYVTDGHHRSISAIQANLPYLHVELDYSAITNETDLKNFKTA